MCFLLVYKFNTKTWGKYYSDGKRGKEAYLKESEVPFSTLGLFLEESCACFASGLLPLQPSQPLCTRNERNER